MKSMGKKIILLTLMIMILLNIQVFAVTGEQVADYAKLFLEYPYSWGGTGLNCGANHWHNGKYYEMCFDCSGFMQYVYKQHGIYISRTTYTQLSDGIWVSVNNMKPGDLILMNPNSKNGQPEHVGMYIGNGQYIHAAGGRSKQHWTGTSGKVRINSVSEIGTIVAVKRIITYGDENITTQPYIPEYAALPNVVPNFEIYINGSPKYVTSVQNGGEIYIWEDRINTIELIDKSNVVGQVVEWGILNQKTGRYDSLGNNSTATIYFSDSFYEKYVNQWNGMTLQLITGGATVRTKQVSLRLEFVPEQANFEVYINGGTKYTEGYVDGQVVDIWDKNINMIELVDASNIKGRVWKWQIWDESTQTWETFGSGSYAAINWSNYHYHKYKDVAGYIILKMETIGGDAGYTSTKTIKLNPVRADHGITVNVETNGIVKQYNVCDCGMNEIQVEENSKVLLQGKSIIEYRLWDPINSNTIYIGYGQINDIKEYKDSVIKLYEEDTYQARIGITRDGGETEGYDIVVKLIKDQIDVKINKQKYDATKENPLNEGIYLQTIEVSNRTGKNVQRWEIFNNKIQQYQQANIITDDYTNINDVGLYISLDNYINLGSGNYCIKVKAVFDNGEEKVREIYQNMFKIQTPNDKQIINAENDLIIKWNGNEEKEYFVRMVRLSELGDQYNTEIVKGDIIKGTSYKIESDKLNPNCNYRIALKAADGMYYDIITISTKEVTNAKITNIDEIKKTKEGEEIKIKLPKIADNQKYLIGLYDLDGTLNKIMETTSSEVVFIRAGQSKAGKYNIGVSVITDNASTQENMYEIEIQ